MNSQICKNSLNINTKWLWLKDLVIFCKFAFFYLGNWMCISMLLLARIIDIVFEHNFHAIIIDHWWLVNELHSVGWHNGFFITKPLRNQLLPCASDKIAYKNMWLHGLLPECCKSIANILLWQSYAKTLMYRLLFCYISVSSVKIFDVS